MNSLRNIEEDINYRRGYENGYKEGYLKALEILPDILLGNQNPQIMIVDKESYEKFKRDIDINKRRI